MFGGAAAGNVNNGIKLFSLLRDDRHGLSGEGALA